MSFSVMDRFWATAAIAATANKVATNRRPVSFMAAPWSFQSDCYSDSRRFWQFRMIADSGSHRHGLRCVSLGELNDFKPSLSLAAASRYSLFGLGVAQIF